MSNKIVCKIFGHKWLYNFSTMPSKAICKRCKSKCQSFNFNWEPVKEFKNDSRTDQQLIEKWTSIVKY